MWRGGIGEHGETGYWMSHGPQKSSAKVLANRHIKYLSTAEYTKFGVGTKSGTKRAEQHAR